jgi:hypothetical protein
MVYRTGTSANTGTLKAFYNGSEVATKTFSPCIPTISGPENLCYNSGVYTLSNAPTASIYWTLSDNSGFTATPSGNSVTVKHTGAGNGIILSACTVNGAVVASKYISSCCPIISGPGVACNSTEYTLLDAPPSQTIYWTVDDPTLFHVNSSGNPTYVTHIGSGTGNSKIRARSTSTSGPVITDLVIYPCSNSFPVPYSFPAGIYGPGNICNSGSAVFAINPVQPATWSVTSGFSLSTNYGTSTTVTATTANSYGTLTAVANGTTYTKSVRSQLLTVIFR